MGVLTSFLLYTMTVAMVAPCPPLPPPHAIALPLALAVVLPHTVGQNRRRMGHWDRWVRRGQEGSRDHRGWVGEHGTGFIA